MHCDLLSLQMCNKNKAGRDSLMEKVHRGLNELWCSVWWLMRLTLESLGGKGEVEGDIKKVITCSISVQQSSLSLNLHYSMLYFIDNNSFQIPGWMIVMVTSLIIHTAFIRIELFKCRIFFMLLLCLYNLKILYSFTDLLWSIHHHDTFWEFYLYCIHFW